MYTCDCNPTFILNLHLYTLVLLTRLTTDYTLPHWSRIAWSGVRFALVLHYVCSIVFSFFPLHVIGGMVKPAHFSNFCILNIFFVNMYCIMLWNLLNSECLNFKVSQMNSINILDSEIHIWESNRKD